MPAKEVRPGVSRNQHDPKRSDGVVEYWCFQHSNTPLLQHSITPTLRVANFPPGSGCLGAATKSLSRAQTRANRRQPLGFRERVGEACFTGLTAAVAHPGRWACGADGARRF